MALEFNCDGAPRAKRLPWNGEWSTRIATHIHNRKLRRGALAFACAWAWGTPLFAQMTPAQGKVIALNGRVEHTVATQEQWTPARMLQPLLVAERAIEVEPDEGPSHALLKRCAAFEQRSPASRDGVHVMDAS